MFFRNHFQSICDKLDNQFRGSRYEGQNSADIGELCEDFVALALKDFFEGQFFAQRGGKVVDINGNMSSQFDVILTSRSTLRIFKDKGLYPVESVAGLISVTSNLTLDKLKGDLKGIASVPKTDPQFVTLSMADDLLFPPRDRIDRWKRYFPYCCIFGFDGTMNADWETLLNEMSGFGTVVGTFPDLVVINKQGMLVKVLKEGTDGLLFHYQYRDFAIDKECYFSPLPILLNEMHKRATWQFSMLPNYANYFANEIPEVVRQSDPHGQTPSALLEAMKQRIMALVEGVGRSVDTKEEAV